LLTHGSFIYVSVGKQSVHSTIQVRKKYETSTGKVRHHLTILLVLVWNLFCMWSSVHIFINSRIL